MGYAGDGPQPEVTSGVAVACDDECDDECDDGRTGDFVWLMM